MNIYDEAIETFHNMHPEYDTANGGTHLLHDKILDALKRAKKVEELLGLYIIQSHLLWGEDFVSATPIKWKIDDLEKELEEMK